MKIEIIDDFLPSYQSDSYVKLFGEMPCGEFPWYYEDDLNQNSYLGNYYFNHMIVNMGTFTKTGEQYIHLFIPLLSRLKLSMENLWRLKANLYPRTQRIFHHRSHTDYDPDSGLGTCLYYVNNNNGMTVFDGKRKVRSRKNRAILFDGSNRHHSTTPSNCNWRCSINIDYKL